MAPNILFFLRMSTRVPRLRELVLMEAGRGHGAAVTVVSCVMRLGPNSAHLGGQQVLLAFEPSLQPPEHVFIFSNLAT